MRVGVLNNPRRPLLDEIEWAAVSGFDFIEISFEAPHAALESTAWRPVREALAAREIDVLCRAASYLPFDNPSPLVRQASMDELRRSIDAAAGLGAPLCTLNFCGWPAHLSEAQGYDYWRQLLAIAVAHGAERNVTVALKNPPDNRHLLKWLREIFQRAPNLAFTLDVGHANLTPGHNLTRDFLFALGERLRHVYLSDNDGVTNAHLPFGAPASGGIDLRRELRHLHSFRFDGSITLHVCSADRRWITESARTLRALWREVTDEIGDG